MFRAAGGTLIDTAAAYGAGRRRAADRPAAGRAGRPGRDGHRHQGRLRRSATGSGWSTPPSGRCCATWPARCAGSGTDHVDLWQLHAWGEAPLARVAERGRPGRPIGHGALRRGLQLRRLADRPGRHLAAGRRRSDADRQRPGRVLAAGPARRGGGAAGGGGLRARGVSPGRRWAAGCSPGSTATAMPKGSRAATEHFAWFVEPYLSPRSRGVVEAVVRAADGLDLTPLQVALLWVRDAPGVTAPAAGRADARSAGSSPGGRGQRPAGGDRLGARRRVGRSAPGPPDSERCRRRGELDRERHPDDPAADPDVAGSVAVAPQPGQLPAAVLGVLGEELADRRCGKPGGRGAPAPPRTRRLGCSSRTRVARSGRLDSGDGRGSGRGPVPRTPATPSAPARRAVEQADEVQVGRQAERGEPEAADPQPAPGLGVGPPAHQVRDGAGPGILGDQAGLHGLDQRAGELGLHRRVVRPAPRSAPCRRAGR